MTWVYTKEKMHGRVTTEVEVHKFFLSLLYPLPWSNGFSVGTSKRGSLGKIARAHACQKNAVLMIFLDFFNDFFSDLVNDSTFWCMVILHGPHSVYT
jgi:hypothetical protein